MLMLVQVGCMAGTAATRAFFLAADAWNGHQLANYVSKLFA
jgi:hypothetical protein